MAKRRRSNPTPLDSRPARAGGRGQRIFQFPLVPLLCFLPAVVGFVSLYCVDAPPESRAQRVSALVFLLAPDHLFELWCGGKVTDFSLLDRWPIAVLSAAILVTAWLAGRLLLLGLGVMRLLDRLEQQVFAIGVGLNLVSLYALAIGLAGGLRQRWLFVAPIAALAAANLCTLLLAGSKLAPGPGFQPAILPNDRNADRDQVWSRLTEDNNPRWYWWLIAALPFALVIVLGAMLPPGDFDVREYHLQAPKEWYQNGRIDFLPHNIYANMPLGSELTSLWAMALAAGKDGWWWGALSGKTVMACYSLLSAAALIAFGRRLHSVAVGVIAAVIYLSVPWTGTLAMAGYNEGPVGLYSLLAIFALWLANQNRPDNEKLRLSALAGFCAGSAVACKYPPLLFVVIPLTIWILLSRRVGCAHRSIADKNKVGTAHPTLWAAAFLATVLAACGLWFAKNWALTNNPTYPLLYSVFDGRTRTPEKNAQWMRVHSPQPDQDGNRFSAQQFVDQLMWNLWRTRLASLCIPPLAAMAWFAQSKRRWLAAVMSWMCFVFIAWWLTTHRLDRFLVLVLPLASLVAALGVFAVPHPAWRLATLGFVVLAALAHFPLITLQPDNRYFAPLAMLRRDDRDLSLQGLRVESAHRWLNEHAQPGEKVLLLGDAEPFDLELPAIYNTCFDDCQFTRIFKGRSRAERLAELRDEKIAYVFCSWAHLARYRSPGNYGYTSDYPTPELVHNELVRDQKLLIPIEIESDPASGELFRIADQ